MRNINHSIYASTLQGEISSPHASVALWKQLRRCLGLGLDLEDSDALCLCSFAQARIQGSKSQLAAVR